MGVLKHVQGREFIVHQFHDSRMHIDKISIINGDLANDTGTGKSYILILYQVLDFRHAMEHSMLSVNQANHNNIAIVIVRIEIALLDRTALTMLLAADGQLTVELAVGVAVIPMA